MRPASVNSVVLVLETFAPAPEGRTKRGERGREWGRGGGRENK